MIRAVYLSHHTRKLSLKSAAKKFARAALGEIDTSGSPPFQAKAAPGE
jgi:hypothetical protein